MQCTAVTLRHSICAPWATTASPVAAKQIKKMDANKLKMKKSVFYKL